MIGAVVLTPDLTEMGNLNAVTLKTLENWQSPTQFAICTTVAGQKAANKFLPLAGWKLFGTKKNPNTSNRVSLWVKEYPVTAAATPSDEREYDVDGDGTERDQAFLSRYCCGMKIRDNVAAAAPYIDSNWLVVLRMPADKKVPEGLDLIGKTAVGGAIWTNAEPVKPSLLARFKAKRASNQKAARA